ncbi:MAG TPA: hypothetical protein VE866_06990 [Candidatus Binatia bacterium]|nr:hypothetical protein [Candidatus Binatia bacterium]
MDTTSKPFWVVICAVCGKRVHDGLGSFDDEGRAVHDECYASEPSLASQNSPTHADPINPLGRWRTFATRMIKEAIGVLAQGHN